MALTFDFTPLRLKSLVSELEKTIGIQSGEPLRLDLEHVIGKLKMYQHSSSEEHLPTISDLELLTRFIPKLKEYGLLEALFECTNLHTSVEITKNVLDYYFDNYKEEKVCEYLYNNIHKEVLNIDGWEIWSNKRSMFFEGDVLKNIVIWILQNSILLTDIPTVLGLDNVRQLREDVIKTICHNNEVLSKYLERISTEAILDLLNDDQWQSIHTPIWNHSLPLYCDEAKTIKIDQDIDHPLFELAKRKLQPPDNPKWLSLNDEAKAAYREWSLGATIEAFFLEDKDNERVRFWKRYIKVIDNIKEIKVRNEVEAFCFEIGAFEFIEFRNIGAIYVYSKGSVKIPSRVRNLDNELKFRHLVVNAGAGIENGEGWIPHQGRVWLERANKLINIAIRQK
jgi:hypothetical protein